MRAAKQTAAKYVVVQAPDSVLDLVNVARLLTGGPGGGQRVAAPAAGTQLDSANEPRQPAMSSAMESPRTRGLSLGPTRRTDMEYPLVRSRNSPFGPRWAATSSPGSRLPH